VKLWAIKNNEQPEFIITWLVVSTHLKNISQNGNIPQIGMKMQNI